MRWIWLVPSYIWVISYLARADLAMHLETMGEQRK
jgi:hypothetical protein